MQAQPGVPYQAYRSKRHSRNISATSQQGPNLSPNVSPPPSLRPPNATNGLLNGHGFSEPVVPLQRELAADGKDPDSEKGIANINGNTNGLSVNGIIGLVPNGIKGAVNFVNERRRSVSMADVMTTFEARRSTPPPVSSSVPVSMSPPVSVPVPLPAVKVVPSTTYTAVSPVVSPPSTTSSPATTSPPTSTPTSPPLPPLPVSPTSITASPIDSVKPFPKITSPAPGPVPLPGARGVKPESISTPTPGPSTSLSLPSSPASQNSTLTSPRTNARRISTFRHVPLRAPSARTPLPSSPLRPASTLPPAQQHQRTSSGLSAISRPVDNMTVPVPGMSANTTPRMEARGLKTPEVHAVRRSDPPSRVSSLMSTPILSATALGGTGKDVVPALELDRRLEGSQAHTQAQSHARVLTPEPRAASVPIPQSTSPAPMLAPPPPPAPAPAARTPHAPGRVNTAPPSGIASPSSISPSPSSSSARTSTTITSTGTITPASRPHAPYRPGFQPKGVYRPRTDEFLDLRRNRRDDGRVERTRLERRLEKLVALHFPHPESARARELEKGSGKGKEREEQGKGRMERVPNRRASSFFDFESLRGRSAGELWKGVLQAQAGGGGKGDVRAAEQTITPWEDDAAVSQCPLCHSSFHPITNRKHHCRLCGRIICSLPVKHPQRPQTCSLLFVADPQTGAVEEVGEGVDYGVRRRTMSQASSSGGARKREEMGLGDDEKFLKGVRICRDCRPVLLRRQYTQEVHRVPLFSRLYDAFVALEKEIEEALPQFQELVLSITHDERPSPEASAARKRLLEAFAQYDALAKRIRTLPAPGEPGGSQERVQQAIVNRANIFLQKHMFPLQALPKPKPKPSTTSPSSSSPTTDAQSPPLVDPDSELARVLQPLLEQEALLESFVEEAKAHRKFEDVQTLKANLVEIRGEIDRMLAGAEANVGAGGKGKGKLREARPQQQGRGSR